MSFVDGRFIEQRMRQKDARMAREAKARTTAAGRRLMTLIREPRPEARAQGYASWETGEANPYAAEPDSADAVNWDAGRNDALQEGGS